MLDCGANTAFETLNEELDKPYKSVRILYDVIILPREDAKEVLVQYVDSNKAEDILKKTHCEPPENFFITSGDMVGKSGVWSHFGGWNFERAMIWTDLKNRPQEEAIKLMIDEFNYSRDHAEKLFFEAQAMIEGREANSWISPWPGYVGTGSCSIKDKAMSCRHKVQNNIVVFDIDATTMAVKTNTQGDLPPKSIVYADAERGFQKKDFEGDTLPYSIGIISDGKNFKSILMSPELAGSMFTRLYYYSGLGLKYFDSFDYQRSITGVDIYVWKVDWEGTSVNMPPQEIEEEQEIEETEETTNITEEPELDPEVDFIENATQEEMNTSS